MQSRFLFALLGSLAWAPCVAAQDIDPDEPNPREQVMRRFDTKAPAVGEPIPDITAYDAEGKPFRLRNLTGSYSVLVFGCLT